MAGINNNNFELFTFMNEFMLDETDDEIFCPLKKQFNIRMGLYNVYPRLDLPKLHGSVENIIPQFLEKVFHTF